MISRQCAHVAAGSAPSGLAASFGQGVLIGELVTSLAMRASSPWSVAVRIRHDCQRFVRLGRAALAKMRKEAPQQVLHLQKPSCLPTMHGADLTATDRVLVVVDRSDSGQTMNALYGVQVNGRHGESHDATVLRDVDATLALKDSSEPAEVQIIHTSYGSPRHISKPTRAKLALDNGAIEWVDRVIASSTPVMV